MPNMRMSLTDTLCARVRPEPREFSLRDTRQPGLNLRIQPSGARSWILRGRAAGKQCKWSLGTFPEMGVKAARQAAAALLSGEKTAPTPQPHAPLFAVF